MEKSVVDLRDPGLPDGERGDGQPALGRFAPGFQGTVVIPSDLARQVEQTVKRAKDLEELCREMLATLALPVNADVRVGSSPAQEFVLRWKDRFFALKETEEGGDGKD